MRLSMIVPVRNEEGYIGANPKYFQKATKYYQGKFEIILVLNRRTDGTETIIEKYSARNIYDIIY